MSSLAEARRAGNAASSWRFCVGQSYTAFLVDVHTRKLRYFVAVADDLNFTRAATRLFVAQQALSKQIHELEELVGTPLFERTSRKVSLTPAGEAFLAQARTVLAALDAGVQDALRARGVEVVTVTVGFGLGAALELTAPILAEFHEQRPESQLELREFPFTEPACGLTDGSTDVALVRLPVNNPDIGLRCASITITQMMNDIDERPWPAMKSRPNMVENQSAFTDMIQSVAMKVTAKT